MNRVILQVTKASSGSADKVLGYAVCWLCGVFRIKKSIPSYYILKARLRARVLHNFVENVGVVAISVFRQIFCPHETLPLVITPHSQSVHRQNLALKMG